MLLRLGSRRIATRTLASGRFWCPEEQSDRDYRLREAHQYWFLFSLPLKDLGALDQFIECSACGVIYDRRDVNSVSGLPGGAPAN